MDEKLKKLKEAVDKFESNLKDQFEATLELVCVKEQEARTVYWGESVKDDAYRFGLTTWINQIIVNSHILWIIKKKVDEGE